MKRRISHAGLTLIEVLIALAIFTALSIAVLGVLPGLLRVNRSTQNDGAVTVAAKAFMEAVRTTYSVQAAFDAGVLPAAPDAALLGDLSCTPAQSNPVATWVAPAGGPMLRRVTLTCAGAHQPTYTFTLDVGRPPMPGGGS